MKKYKIATDVFFRKYGENTIVYKTSVRKVAVMNEVCYSVLDFFKDYHTLDQLLQFLSDKIIYEDYKSYEEGMNSFLMALIENGFIEEEFKVLEQKFGLDSIIYHSTIIPKGTLVSAMFELTYRCNEKCRHCYCVDANKKDELDAAKIKSLIDELYDMNVSELTFTGGDIFVRSDTFEILDYAYSKNMMINIFTNGTLLKPDDFYHLQKLHPKSISFSIYSHIPEKHDYFTQLSGSFNKTVSAAKKCIALGIPVNIKSSIVDYNLDDVAGIIELDKSIGAFPQISMSITPRNDGDMSSTELRINDIDKYKEALKTSYSYIEEEYTPQYREMAIKENRICWAGVNNLSINPYGKVYACNALLIECGDVRKQTIKEIWENSAELKKIRSYNMDMLQGCENCTIKRSCSFCMGSSFSEHGSPIKKYREACCIAQAQEKLIEEVKKNENA